MEKSMFTSLTNAKAYIVKGDITSERALYKPKQLHDYVYQNRYNLLTDLRAEFGFSPLELEVNYTSSDISTSSESELSDSLEKLRPKDQTVFKLSIPFEDYIKMEPSLVFHKEGACKKRRRVLRKGAWTNIINEYFYKAYQIPCAYAFKRNKVRLNSNDEEFFFFAEGHCKECKLPVTITGKNEPTYPNSLELIVKATDTRDVQHTKKNSVIGTRRTDIAKELLNTAPTNWRRENARKLMKFGEREPPILPSLSVCRTIRQEAKRKEYGLQEIKNVFSSLQKMKYSSEYAGSIHMISFDDFFVHYWTKNQNYIYKMNAKKIFNKVHIDATGSLVKKIKDEERTSKHIFLYEIVIHIENKSLSVAQMLSESHDTATIEYWLNKWLKDVKKVPQESITDFSLALIAASCRCFNECSIKTYLKLSFSILLGKSSEKPPCYLRIDVAHLINFVSKWNCFLGKGRLIKKFYIRCVGLMVKCTSFRRLEEVILNTLILCKSESCGNLEDDQDLSISEKSKIFLGHCIENAEQDSIILENFSDSEITDESSFEFLEIGNQNNKWVKDIIDKVEMALITTAGSEPNPYYCPNFERKLINILSYCPLWTAIMKDVYNSPDVTASSAIVECDFSILKQVILEHNKRPVRVDKFIACHLRALSGNVNITAASVNEKTYFSDKDETLNELEEEETWRGKNPKKDFKVNQNIQIGEEEMVYDHKKFSYTKYRADNEYENNSNVKKIKEKTDKKNIKKKKNIYLTPYPNVKFVLQSPNIKQESLTIIKNGNFIEPIKINGNAYKVTNTCPFDALMHSIAVISIDNENYMQYAKNTQNDFFKCIQMYLDNGVGKKLYQLRTQILSKIYTAKPSAIIPKFYFVDAEDSMGGIISKLFIDTPSALQISQCQNATCCNNVERYLTFWTINLNVSHSATEGFYNSVTKGFRIINKPCIAPCKLRRTIEVVPKEHLIIELNFEKSVLYSLKDFPTSISLRNENYILGSIIVYLEGGRGHFISFCRRRNNTWEQYDDLKSSVTAVDPNEMVGNIQIIIYSKLSK